MNLLREKRTIAVMIGLYCRHHHGKDETFRTDGFQTRLFSHHHGKGETLCASCASLLEYATRRIDRCKFGHHKPVCAKCTVHCYKPDMRQQVRQVMRYAGPRMLYKSPYLAICHLIDSWRKR